MRISTKKTEDHVREIQDEHRFEEFDKEVDQFMERVLEGEEKHKTALAKIQSGKHQAPRRLLLYGTQAVGKSTFAATAPSPIFVPTEDGLGDIDCQAFPCAQSYEEVLVNLRALYKEEHTYRTVVIDSVDWLENLIWQALCAREGKSSIEDFGYGKGYTMALTLWRDVLNALGHLRAKKAMTTILIAHAKIERFEDPAMESYDRYVPRIHKGAAAILQEWCDEVFFCTYQAFTRTEKGKFDSEVTKADTTGKRIMRTSERPFCAAKNRLRLPEELPLEWGAYAKFFNGKEGS